MTTDTLVRPVLLPLRPRPAYLRVLPATALVLVSGLALYYIVYRALLATGDILYFPTLFVVGAATTPAAFAVYMSRLAGPIRVGARALGLFSLWGGTIGAVVAGVLETDTGQVLGGLPTPFIGFIEESAKLIVPLAVVLFARQRGHTRADGLAIGVAVGVGFATLETMGYAFAVLLQSKGNLHAMDQVLLMRGLLAPAGHAAWTGLATAALWRVGLERTGRSVVAFVGTFLGVVVLHALWDATGNALVYLALAAVSLSLLHLSLHRTHRAR
jgi:RsiW-degrading membrane proteinase PrsW (M82 family)